jgi:hypothetical protein
MAGMATSLKMHSATRPVSTLATSVDGAVHSRPVHFRIGAFELDRTSGELTHEGNTTPLSSTPGISFSDQSD